MRKTYKKLFEPFNIGQHTLKNRIIKSPVTTRLSLTTGEASPQLIHHYAQEAQGGAAMIITESTEVEARHPRVRPNLRVDSDAQLAGLHELAEAIHLNGALACLQLRHVGMWGVDPVSPSGIACRRSGGRDYVQPRALSLEEIDEVIALFSAAAYRAKRAEFDMVEMHGGTSYLLQQFFSPHTNKREDGWGTTFEGRIRLPLEVLRQIHKKCGLDFPVGYRIVLDELLPDGYDFEEATAFVMRLEQEGIAYISPQVGTYETAHLGESQNAMRSPKAQTVKYTEPLKKKVNIPVFATHQIHEPELMEEILEKNQADAILLGRPLLADPEMPNKLKDDRLEDICLCITCGHCNDTTAITQQKISCTQNPETGRERDYAIQPALSPRMVLVIGGGPAGLEAARVAALRGHNVTLLEKNDELGGQVRVAALPIGKDILMPYVIGWRVRQCQKAGVKIELGKEGTLETIRTYNPDVVIIATGASPLLPAMPGADRRNVVTAWDVLRGKAKVGRRAVIVGGGIVGVETADFIAEKGLSESVIVIEMLPKIAQDMSLINAAYLIQKLEEYEVNVVTNSTVREITDKGVVTIGNDGNERTVAADTVVLALGAVSDNKLARRLEGKIPQMYTIGDCKRPRNLTEAILEGAHVGRQV